MRTWAELEGTKARYNYRPCATCGGPCAKHAEHCKRCSPKIPRGENHYAWKGDAARVETKRERAQAMFELGPCERCGADGTDRHHIDGDPGNNVRENISILCRRCHMEVDGRMGRFREHNKHRKPRPPKPCEECGRLAKPTWRGLCHTCDMRKRRAIKRAAASA